MTPDFFDIHSHLNFPDYDADREVVIAKLAKNRIFTTTVGTDVKTSQEAVALADKYPHLFATIGVHPTHTEPFNAYDFESLAKNPKVLAIGECGLDYGKTNSITDEDKKAQMQKFEAQIAFAVAHKKPLMIHCRNAYPDVLDMLESKKREVGDVLQAHMHFFAGSLEVLRRCLDNNFTVSFTGVVTFVQDYHDLVRFVPLSMLMVETDAPFVTPIPYRGKRNEPTYVEYVAQSIALIREENIREVQKALKDNALRVFRPMVA